MKYNCAIVWCHTLRKINRLLVFTVGNIHPKYRSQLKCIFVSTLDSNTVILKHGLNQFLQPFVSSVWSLVKNGLDISIKNEIRHFNELAGIFG